MNTEKHTVTIPLADYQELVAAKEEAELKFQKLKNGLVDVLRRATFATHNRPSLEQVIDMIRGA